MGRRTVVPPMLQLGTTWRERSVSRPWPLFPLGKNLHQYPLDKRRTAQLVWTLAKCYSSLVVSGFSKKKNEFNSYILFNFCCLFIYFYFMLRLTVLTPNDPYSGRTAPLTSRVAFYIFIQQIYILNIFNMVYTLRFFFSSKCSLFHNSNIFNSCIIHILYTGCAKI